MKITTQKKYRSNNKDQNKLKIVCDQLCDRIEDILNIFDVEYRHNGKLYSMRCPIHNGDNPSALNIYPEGETYRGNWKCRTHNCEEVFKGSIIGFIRGILSNIRHNWQNEGDQACTFAETLQWCEEFLSTKIDDIIVSKTQTEKKKFACAINTIAPAPNKYDNKILRQHIVNGLQIPAQYYIDRGYSKEILIKYDVGLCDKPNKEMHNRVVVPIYDMQYEYMVGCTGRSIQKKCEKCETYHSNECPDQYSLYKFPKWKHNTGFKTQEYLYNMWFAKDYISRDGYVIIVESPGNVWKLEENNIHNSVAIFGTNLSSQQKLLLDASGALTIFTIMDNDDAGKKAAKNIYEKCHKTYKVYDINICKNDIAEMTSEEIETHIKDKIRKYL